MIWRDAARQFGLPTLFVLVWTAAILAWVGVFNALPLPDSKISRPDSKISRLCDEQVQQVLTTTDPVELQRAIFLVGWFNCAIGRRLP
jgi:hypothetical protein